MNYLPASQSFLSQSGTQLGWSGIKEGAAPDRRNAWQEIWSEALRTHAVKALPPSTGSWIVLVAYETIPVRTAHIGTTAQAWLTAVEVAFGRSTTNLAQILQVTRPTIYHYRDGKEPTVQNKRRLQALAEFISDWISQIDRSFEVELKTEQPEGKSLLDYLSEPELDFVALRRIISRSVEGRRRDRALRLQLADELTREESIEERRDIVRERHGAGEPVYVGDPDNPGRLIQMLPDGRRIRGQMVKRQFVPDEK